MRYVEGEPAAAQLVQRAEDWEWSSLRCRLDGDEGNLLEPGPYRCPQTGGDSSTSTRPKHIAGVRTKPAKPGTPI